eukprot:8867334-Pyramimonas_sp.AAC.1
MHSAQTDSDIQYVDWETLVADPADGPVAVVTYFVAARYLSAGVSAENFADELFEEIFTGHNEINLAD